MLDVNKLIASVEECLGWPYVSPGTNDSSGIDCSGFLTSFSQPQYAHFPSFVSVVTQPAAEEA